MIKKLSIRAKITIWFTAALLIVVLFAYLTVFGVSRQMLLKTIRDNLIETVEHNVDEVEFFVDFESLRKTRDIDHYVEYKDGFLEVDDDFLDAANEVYTALYSEDVQLLYGENPIAGDTAGMEFKDSQVQKLRADGRLYYVFDRKLTAEGLEGLWLRGIVSDEQGEYQMSEIIHISLILLPILVLIASVGGYLIAWRALRPIKKISETARQIEETNDLKKRIVLGAGNDELHQLARSFNDMFGKLEKTFEQERQFTSDVSHELRTPVSVITAQCEFILEKTRDAKEYEDALRVIQRQGRKMARLINHMLDFCRLETNPDRYVRETIDLSELVTTICTDMSLIKENGITLTYRTEEAVFTGNRELLSRLLANLINNAYRYGREDGHIRVILNKTDAEILLSVEDDGIGIPEEEQEKIFRRFYQADSSRSGAGTGLGLAMAYEIARFHGGRITVESKPGKGSTFTLHLPLR